MSEMRSKRQLFDSQLKEQKDFWVKQLSPEIGFSGLRLDHRRPDSFSGAKDQVELALADDTQQKLSKLTGDSNFLIYAALMAALKVCLHKYTGSASIVVGSPSSRKEGASGTNLLPIVDEVAGHESFREFLLKVRENLEQSYAHEDYPYQRLLGDVGRKPLENKCELFDVALIVKDFHADLPEAKNDLTLAFTCAAGRVAGEVRYNSSLFQRQSIERFAAHFLTLLQAALEDLNTIVADLPLMTAEETQRLLVGFNDTDADFPRHLGIHQVFEARVRQTPDALALVAADAAAAHSLTYAELNGRANRLAHYLRACGVGAEARVGVCLERSVEMVVAALAILKAGGAYVPLDPTYPAARLELLVADAGVELVLTSGELADGIAGVAGVREVLRLEDEKERIEGYGEANLAVETRGEQLAYVMYTSGSTGRPKGVGVTHRGVLRLVCNNNYVSFSAEEVFLQFAPFSFDASTFEIWGSLLNGARLALAPSHALSLAELGEVVARHGVTTLWLTAGLFNQMIEEGGVGLGSVRQLLAGGDVLSATHVRQALELLPQARVINGYGPTEATTFSCCHVMESSAEVGESVLIGRPIANTQAYILDERMRTVAVGVAGELYIGGEGLMRGYLNEPSLTAQRLVPHPYAREGGERLYRTGDVTRWRADGSIEFIGRVDNQVKLRGFRIEPGEIETVLAQHPCLREVAVIARANAAGDKSLFAYVVKDREATDDELRDFLGERLPPYMMPSQFVAIERLPLTPNGKVDRAALPMPEKMRPALDEDYLAPRNPVEKLVAEIWREVLDIDRVGVHDNFFKLGGHSLLATKIATRLREAFQLEINLARIFEAPTVAEIAVIIEEAQSRPRNISDAEIERMPRLDEDLAQVLAELANLPEQEAQSLLLKETSAADHINRNE